MTTNRTYAGARIGILRMNRIIELGRAHGTLTIKFVAQEFECYEKCAKGYLQRLVEMGMMTERAQAAQNSVRYFDLVPSAKFITLPEPPKRPRPSVAKPKKKRVIIDGSRRRVQVVPAAQIGMPRDPLVQALFGDRRAA